MGTPFSRWKRVTLVIVIAAILASMALPIFNTDNRRPPGLRSLNKAKGIYRSCNAYAIDNGGNFPPSLDSLFPDYLSDREVLISPFMPGEPVGYIYTSGLKHTSPAGTPIIEDKFALSKGHFRVVVYADGSGRCIDCRSWLRAYGDAFKKAY